MSFKTYSQFTESTDLEEVFMSPNSLKNKDDEDIMEFIYKSAIELKKAWKDGDLMDVLEDIEVAIKELKLRA